MTYDLDYFIAKFETIPEERWCVEEFADHQGRHCALGHCGMRESEVMATDEGRALTVLCVTLDPSLIERGYRHCYIIARVNDGKADIPGDTPRARVLTYLKALKEFYR